MRNFFYKYDSDTKLNSGEKEVSSKKYNEDVFTNVKNHYSTTPSGTIDIGPTFNLNLIASRVGGIAAD